MSKTSVMFLEFRENEQKDVDFQYQKWMESNKEIKKKELSKKPIQIMKKILTIMLIGTLMFGCKKDNVEPIEHKHIITNVITYDTIINCDTNVTDTIIITTKIVELYLGGGYNVYSTCTTLSGGGYFSGCKYELDENEFLQVQGSFTQEYDSDGYPKYDWLYIILYVDDVLIETYVDNGIAESIYYKYTNDHN